MDQNARMHGYRDTGFDSSYSSSFEQEDVNYQGAAATTLGSLLRAPKPRDSAASPTTPLAVGRIGRHPFYSRRQSVNETMLELNGHTDSYTPPAAPNNPSEFGAAASLSSYARSQSLNGEAMLNDSTGSSNASGPLAFPSSGRTSPYARSPARSPGAPMSGRIHKPGSGRSPSFRGNKGANLGQRSHQMDSLQSQLYNDMRTLGVDHHKIVHWLEKLKGLYHNRGEQQQQENYTYSGPESPLGDGSQPPHVVEDPAVHGSIALLKHKFAQLERFKESTQGQQIPLYPHQSCHEGRSPDQPTPASPSSSTARAGPSGELSPDSSYEFDETTAALLALQQEMMWSSARSSPSGTPESNGLKSPSLTAARDSPSSNKGCRGEEANHALHSYQKLRQHNLGRQSNLGAFKDSSLRGAATVNTGFGGTTTEVSLESLFAAERTESVGTTRISNSQKKSASSIENAMAKLSFNLTPKFSSPKGKISRSWGTGLSLNMPPAYDRSGGKFRGTEVPEAWSNASDVQFLYNKAECREDIRIEHEEVVDTSLRL